jgi:hypothetical protein
MLWITGTIVIRTAGHHLIRMGSPFFSLGLYLASFVVMGLLVQRMFYRLGIERGSWPAAATLLALPTLVLDPFSCIFFSTLFPRLNPCAAGLFGGWMLIFCAGAIAGGWLKR